MLKLLAELENVFIKYIPWHSESELQNALGTIAELRNEIAGNAPAVADATNSADTTAATPDAPVGAENPTTSTADSSVADAGDSTTGVTTLETSASDTSATTAPAPVTTVNAVVNTVAEPEWTPFPGSYTPPPAA